ncbi:hypothetical protein ACELLULO517_15855 [Acidisoma cellulosilytica]|uniref:Uncharacterized protein n=1 Tax=Acidisoma cellulosilyticum TaxID=2802395 RepID=A0A963Z4P9_9PROT|nr:hypothetical protein [Acidisoma cellulosilyticum]MCB8881723.1 hypothetical protein [Acidisoma cellulosilyticum]
MSGNQTPTPPNADRLTLTRIALAAGLIIQLGTGIWYAALAFSELGDHARRIVALEASQASSNTQIQASLQSISLQLATITQKVADLKSDQGSQK